MPSHCPYCGNAALNADDPDINAISKGLDITVYKCGSCGICSRVIMDDEPAGSTAAPYSCSSQNGMPGIGEGELLRSARKQMIEQHWDEALDLLFKKRFPYEHPLEFIFYRNICQAAILFSSKSAGPKERSLMLNIISINLSGLNYYLEDADPETISRTLQNIAEALLLPADAIIRYSESHKDCYYHHYIVLLNSLADILEAETIGDNPKQGEYLKTAVRLLHKCLEIAQEKPSEFLPYTERQLKIPSAERQQICDKIDRINSKLRRIYPTFVPIDPLPAPEVIPYNVFYMRMTANAAVIIICMILCYIFYLRYTQLFRDLLTLAKVIGVFLIIYCFLFHVLGLKPSRKKHYNREIPYYWQDHNWKDR